MDVAIDSRKFLNDSEYKKFVKATFRLPKVYGLPLRFLGCTGCRVGEIFLVRQQDFRLGDKQPQVWVPTLKREGRPVRSVHFHSEGMVRELKKAIRGVSPGDVLFAISKRSVQRKMEEVLEKLGLREDKSGLAHILRHTRASQLAAAGFTWDYIAQQLGWSSLEMARIYSHSDAQTIARLGRKLPEVGR